MFHSPEEKTEFNQNKIQLRAVEEEDALTLSMLATTTFLETYDAFNSSENMQDYIHTHFSVDIIRSEIVEPLVRYFILFCGNEAAAYCMLDLRRPLQNSKYKKAIELSRIYVLKKYQGYKLGKKLIEVCEHFAKQNLNEVLWLGVWQKNENAIRFYEHEGFVIHGTTTFILGDDVQQDYIMVKKLTY